MRVSGSPPTWSPSVNVSWDLCMSMAPPFPKTHIEASPGDGKWHGGGGKAKTQEQWGLGGKKHLPLLPHRRLLQPLATAHPHLPWLSAPPCPRFLLWVSSEATGPPGAVPSHCSLHTLLSTG